MRRSTKTDFRICLLEALKYVAFPVQMHGNPAAKISGTFFADMVGFGWVGFLRKQRLNPLNVGTGSYQNAELPSVPCCTTVHKVLVHNDIIYTY